MRDRRVPSGAERRLGADRDVVSEVVGTGGRGGDVEASQVTDHHRGRPFAQHQLDVAPGSDLRPGFGVGTDDETLFDVGVLFGDHLDDETEAFEDRNGLTFLSPLERLPGDRVGARGHHEVDR